jgi:uncharacterized protein (TIRG00374 family)
MKWDRKTSLAVLVVLLGVFVVLVSQMNLGMALKSLGSVRWGWVVAVALVNIFHTWIEALRWHLIISSAKQGTRVSLAFEGLLVGVLGNILLPLRLGDGGRAYYVSKKGNMAFSQAFSTVVLDRVVDIAFFLIMVSLTALFFHFSSTEKRTFLIILASLSIGVGVLIVLARVNWRARLKFKSRLGQKLAGQMENFRLGLTALRKAGIIFPTGLLAGLSWLLRLSLVGMIFIAFRLELPLIAVPVTLILLNLGIAAVNTPANLGGFELSMVAALKLFALDTETAVSAAVLLHVAEVLPILGLGFYVLWRTGFRLKALRPAEKISRSLSPQP